MAETRTLGILLAGGLSSRMGTDKARLEFRGQPLWLHMRELLLRAGCAQVWISGSPALAENQPRFAADIVPDRIPGLGPLGGLSSVVEKISATATGDRLLVVPVDLPLLTTAVLQELLGGGTKHAGAHFADNALPALIRDTPAFRRAVVGLLASERRRDHSFIALHAALGAEVLPLAPGQARALTNANTPEEWALAGKGNEPATR